MSEEALVHLKSYKYSSVDKSLISNYILKHYVCHTTPTDTGELAKNDIVEWIRRTSAIMARAKYGHIVGVLLHSVECDLLGDIHARFSWASMYLAEMRSRILMLRLGAIMVILQLCLWIVDVFDHGQCGWETGATNRNIKWSWGAL